MHDRERHHIDRRTALFGMAATTMGALVACGGGGSSASPLTPSSTTTTTPIAGATTPPSTAPVSSSGACAATPEGEIGPYFADDTAAAFNRSNILANLDGTSAQTGVPFTLTINVVDTEASCAAVAGAQVDIWHCNAAGVYSDEGVENTSGLTWLRGFALSGATGQVAFTTIVPGWYDGRTTHIHLRVRSKYSEASSTSDGTNTTQVFFPQSLLNTLNTTVAPYSAHGTNPTTNASDRVYATQTAGKMELVLAGSTASGYTASITIGLPI